MGRVHRRGRKAPHHGAAGGSQAGRPSRAPRSPRTLLRTTLLAPAGSAVLGGGGVRGWRCRLPRQKEGTREWGARDLRALQPRVGGGSRDSCAGPTGPAWLPTPGPTFLENSALSFHLCCRLCGAAGNSVIQAQVLICPGGRAVTWRTMPQEEEGTVTHGSPETRCMPPRATGGAEVPQETAEHEEVSAWALWGSPWGGGARRGVQVSQVRGRSSAKSLVFGAPPAAAHLKPGSAAWAPSSGSPPTETHLPSPRDSNPARVI